MPFAPPAPRTATLLAASTHEGEEALVLDAFLASGQFRHLILAPRHPQRGEALAAMLAARYPQNSHNIQTDKAQDLIVIPYNSLIEADGNKAFVFIVKNNKVKRQSVTINKFENNKVFIKDGLQKTDQIVISNSAYLNEQSTIKIIK